MRLKLGKILALALLASLTAPVVLAHTPLKPGDENESLETAYEIPDPTKSWTLYRELHEGGEAQYYKMILEPGDRLLVSLYTPVGEDPAFLPGLAVMGPGIEPSGTLPDFVEAPSGMGVAVIEPNRPERPEYEPFTPASYYFVASFEFDVSEQGAYHFAVYEPERGGRYGVAVGYREEFTLAEWLMIPLDVIGIHQWEGQPLWLILSPMIVALALGFGLLLGMGRLSTRPLALIGATAGLLYLGGGLMTLMQMVLALIPASPGPSVVLTIVFVALPIILGLVLLRKVLGVRGGVTLRDRAVIALLSLLGVATWAGLLVGPSLALLTSIMPFRD